MSTKIWHRLREHADRSWLLLGNLIVICAAGSFVVFAPDGPTAAGWATFAAAFASVLALLWLVAGYRVQAAELNLQREELRLQRIALEQQALELANSAKMSSLGQIQALLEKAEATVRDCDHGIFKPHDLLGLWFKNISLWRDISKSRDPLIVQNAYHEWLKTETLVRLYLSYVVTAMKMYIQYHTPHAVDESKDPETFAYVYQTWVAGAPFLSNHVSTAKVLAEYLLTLAPGIKATQLAGMTAAAMFVGKRMFKEGALEEMRDALVKEGRNLPAICDPWPDLADDVPPPHIGRFPIPEHLKPRRSADHGNVH